MTTKLDLDAVYANDPPHKRLLRAKAEGAKRSYGSWRLGASSIGSACKRQVWLNFRWASSEAWKGQMIRLFDTGHRNEDVIIGELKAAGYLVHGLNPKTGKQFEFRAYEDWVTSKLDGIIKGNELGDKWHVLELKTANDRNFKKVVKEGIKKAKPEYWVQLHKNMQMCGLTKALYVMENKNNSDLWSQVVEYDPAELIASDATIEDVLDMTSPMPAGIGKQATNFNCKFCKFKQICFEKAVPERRCRNCEYFDPRNGFVNYCTKHNRELSFQDSIRACDDYKLIQSIWDHVSDD